MFGTLVQMLVSSEKVVKIKDKGYFICYHIILKMKYIIVIV